jgi:hypothetical protein
MIFSSTTFMATGCEFSAAMLSMVVFLPSILFYLIFLSSLLDVAIGGKARTNLHSTVMSLPMGDLSSLAKLKYFPLQDGKVVMMWSSI